MIKHWPVYGVVPLKFGSISFKMYSKGDDHITNAFYYAKGYQEHNDLRLFLALAKRASVILDVGANTGLYSILLDKVAPDARIFSFEPHPSNIKRLRKNFEINKTKAEIVGKAVGDKQGKIQFHIPQDDSISDTSSAEADFSKSTYGGKLQWKIIDVDQTTLDAFVTARGIEKVALAKIDVEGYEESVFKGARLLTSKSKPVIQCEIFLDERKKDFFEKFIVLNDYCAYLILSDGLLRTDQVLQSNKGNLNYLFSVKRTTKQYMPFSELDEIARELL